MNRSGRDLARIVQLLVIILDRVSLDPVALDIDIWTLSSLAKLWWSLDIGCHGQQ